jgi:hypothetical protein
MAFIYMQAGVFTRCGTGLFCGGFWRRERKIVLASATAIHRWWRRRHTTL